MPQSGLRECLRQLEATGLGRHFNASTVARAQAYVDRVREIETAGPELVAWIQGGERAPYRTTVRVEARDFFGEREIHLSSHCTCAVGSGCKHAAALLLAAMRPGMLVAKPRAAVLNWVQELPGRLGRAEAPRKKAKARDGIFYLFFRGPYGGVRLGLLKGRLNAEGGLQDRAEDWANHEQALLKSFSFVSPEDVEIFRLLRQVERRHGGYGWPELTGTEGWQLLEQALATGRALVRLAERGDAKLLAASPERPGQVRWELLAEGLSARLSTQPEAAWVLPTEPLAYIDASAGAAGLIAMDDQPAVRALLTLPPLTPVEVPLVAAALEQAVPGLPSPTGGADLEEIAVPCQPVLSLNSMGCWSWKAHRGYAAQAGYGSQKYDYALVSFVYDGVSFPAGSAHAFGSRADGRPVRVQRDPATEAAAWRGLLLAGFQPVKSGWLITGGRRPEGMLGLESEAHWSRFFAEQAPALRAEGWRIDCPADFRHRVLLPTEWLAELEEGDNGWFELSLGIEVEGRRLDLAPLLHAVFQQDPRWLDRRQIDALDDTAPVVVRLPAGEKIALPAGRLKPLARTLVDLFDRPAQGLRVSAFDAPRVTEALAQGWETRGLEPLNRWLERIGQAARVTPVAPPAGLAAELRPYQLQGLAWLQHLRAHELGGILADDMGLGKTIQTLAHLLTEKAAGRLDKPVLAVLPTSLVFNWQREAERFTPGLRVLNLRGADRAERFEHIPGHDLCLTTYPLLWRDQDALAEHEYHSLILDEAQTVKNAASQAAQVVRKLRARNRLCLTGTPLENHLGELWSQFDFLLPGFLGDSRDFVARWRTPIEKRGDTVRRDLLARRLAPFILRRRKEEVARELPPKTVVVRSVELEGRQRDLYETVRATMDKRVREEIAAKGFARSQIVILDALLKLRQVCCDPRLLKTDTAAKVKERAKLDLLMEMLPELVEEGRRVLLFSQFTSMLGLIEDALAAAGIASVKLTGQTRDREAPITRFQAGEVPVFLISLKAGGVGLNLTAADTVIHFDPWWNPAAENQATDRAHRIGQTRSVFVYKLVVAGSIEEKILAMQEKKAALAAGVLAEDDEVAVKFSEADIRALLAPLPETGGGEAPARRGRAPKAGAGRGAAS